MVVVCMRPGAIGCAQHQAQTCCILPAGASELFSQSPAPCRQSVHSRAFGLRTAQGTKMRWEFEAWDGLILAVGDPEPG